MRQKVVIIGVSFSSRLALARAVGKLGCEITIVAWGEPSQQKPVDGYSKYVERVLFCKKEETAFVSLLMEKCADDRQKVILLPDCDFSVSVVDSHMDELKSHFLMPHINHLQGAIAKWSDKSRQKKLAASLGMNVTHSITIRSSLSPD